MNLSEEFLLVFSRSQGVHNGRLGPERHHDFEE